MSFLFAVIVPYVAAAIFVAGVTARILLWARSDVPFRIPLVGGQQKSLPWIKPGRLESPHTKLGVFVRMALEILLFRSLFRNTAAELRGGPRLTYAEEKFLWLGALAFHWSLLLILIRHLRFFLEPVPRLILSLQKLDGFFEAGMPVVYLTDMIIVVALSFLLLRRLVKRQIRYISLPADYFVLLLLAVLTGTGIWMRYATTADLVKVKEFALGLAAFSPRIPENAGLLFYTHLFLASLLAAWFPFSKLMHMGGVFLSPTRNLCNHNRMKRHLNPWDHPVKVHTYAEWENEFRDKIKAAGLPLEGR